jgi:tripartite-type tricarboxylate transporter receptor subunit TctC
VHVPYRGETLVLNDMIGGHVDVFFGNIAAGGPPFRDGVPRSSKIKPLECLTFSNRSVVF